MAHFDNSNVIMLSIHMMAHFDNSNVIMVGDFNTTLEKNIKELVLKFTQHQPTFEEFDGNP